MKPSEMKTSKAGDDLIKSEEGLRLIAYPDGGGVWTIGYGHTRSVKKDDRCTPEQADKWRALDIIEAENTIKCHVNVDLTQAEFDALVSWQFNTGGLILKSGKDSKALMLLNAGNYEGCISAMGEWNKIHDKTTGKIKVDNGLQNRRAREALLWHSDFVSNDNGSPTPAEPPATVAATTTGKLQLGALTTGLAAAVTQGVSTIQPVIDAGKAAIGSVSDLQGVFHTVGIVLVVFSITFTVFTLWHKSATLRGAA